MKNFLFYIALILLIASALFAQKGTITGKVTDITTNEPMPAANITLLGTQYGAAADNDGNYVIENVPPGIYTVRATVIGYQPVTETDVVVTPVKPVQLDFELRQTVIEFGDITVTPDYFTSSSDKPISVQRQTNEEIRRLPGSFEDVVRAVSILPGVAQAQAGRNDLIVRGGAPSENLYVVDGIEVPNINHFGTQGSSGGPQSYINLDFVESTEFSTGGFGVRYGDRLSSVLSLDLKEGRRDRIGGKATLAATQFGLDVEGPLTSDGSFLFSARRSYLDFIFKANGFGFVPEYWDFLGKAVYEPSPNNKITLLGIAALDRTNFFNDTKENLYNNSQILGNTQNQAVAGLSWRHVFKGGFSNLTLSQTLVDYKLEQTDTLQQTIFKNNSLEQEIALTENLVYNFTPNTEATFGAQGKLVRFNADLYLPPFRDYFGNQLSVNTTYDTLGVKAATWLQVSHYFPQLKVILGTRLNYFNLINDNLSFSPRLALKYSFNNRTSVKGSVGLYHQAPSYIWTVSHEQNRDLKFIQVRQYILGFEQLLSEDTKFSVEAFFKDYKNYPVSETRPYLVLSNTGAGFGGSQSGFASFGLDPLASDGTGWSRGIELFAQKKFSESPFYGTGSLTFSQTEFTALDGVSRPGSYDQRWIFNIGGGYVLNDIWEFNAKFRFFTGRPYTPFDPGLTKSPQNYNSERVPANHALDVRVERRWYFDNIMMITYIDVQNAYDYEFRGMPRYDAFKQKIENMNSIGILPSLGIGLMF